MRGRGVMQNAGGVLSYFAEVGTKDTLAVCIMMMKAVDVKVEINK